MNAMKRKRPRPKRDELPKRYRCRDKYNKALHHEMNQFVSTKVVEGTRTDNDDVETVTESAPVETDTR